MQAYRKFVVALIGFVVVVLHAKGVNIADDISTEAIALLTSLGVFVVPNH